MIGLDTNILVRYLVKDDKKQAEKASACIKNADVCFINLITFCELVWVLDSAYGYSKTEIIEVIEKLLITRQLEIESKDTVRDAIHDYKTGSGDISDYLIGRINKLNGCDVTYTFDLSLKKSPFFSLLPKN